jgi:hypothetical protein
MAQDLFFSTRGQDGFLLQHNTMKTQGREVTPGLARPFSSWAPRRRQPGGIQGAAAWKEWASWLPWLAEPSISQPGGQASSAVRLASAYRCKRAQASKPARPLWFLEVASERGRPWVTPSAGWSSGMVHPIRGMALSVSLCAYVLCFREGEREALDGWDLDGGRLGWCGCRPIHERLVHAIWLAEAECRHHLGCGAVKSHARSRGGGRS